MSNNIFFLDGGRSLFGERFGTAVEYEVTETEDGRYQIRFKPNMIQPESPYFPPQSKLELVSEATERYANRCSNTFLLIYDRKVEIRPTDAKAEIETKIIDLQKSFFRIDSSLDTAVQHQAKALLNTLVRGIDIY